MLQQLKAISTTTSYTLTDMLEGHSGLILCMAVTEDGRYLVSGGEDGCIIWELRRMKIVQRIPTSGIKGAVTAVGWVRREDTIEEGLVYGTHNGWIRLEEVFFQQIISPSEILSIAYEPISNKMVVSNRKGVVSLFPIDPINMKITREGWAKQFENTLPIAVAFDAQLNILVFGAYDSIYVLETGTGDLHNNSSVLHAINIGHAVCNAKQNIFCVDNPLQGCVLYRLNEKQVIRTFEVPRERKQARPKQVAFAESCSIVVSGSDHGAVYMFHRRSGELLQKLTTKNNSWIQSVSTANIGGTDYIFAGEALQDGNSRIFVFQKSGFFVKWWLGAPMLLVMLAAATAVYQNALLILSLPFGLKQASGNGGTTPPIAITAPEAHVVVPATSLSTIAAGSVMGALVLLVVLAAATAAYQNAPLITNSNLTFALHLLGVGKRARVNEKTPEPSTTPETSV
ncbi:WD40 repeat-like protein [Dendrothele bispora CBS 962.96]|uniref:WD40 repeat-like protein n=1 Tax=Dendrothele bispora (strain CBS 962.96) TaxID=1314807 RepID=A0A4S8MWS8_DENBC|nr:WD40 repeat-like protein [Dendrothele bispora CBS 962.96]